MSTTRAVTAGRHFRDAVRVRRKYGFEEMPRTLKEYDQLMDARGPEGKTWRKVMTDKDRDKLRLAVHWFEGSMMPHGIPWSLAQHVKLIKSERKRMGWVWEMVDKGGAPADLASGGKWRVTFKPKIEVGPDGDWRVVTDG